MTSNDELPEELAALLERSRQILATEGDQAHADQVLQSGRVQFAEIISLMLTMRVHDDAGRSDLRLLAAMALATKLKDICRDPKQAVILLMIITGQLIDELTQQSGGLDGLAARLNDPTDPVLAGYQLMPPI